MTKIDNDIPLPPVATNPKSTLYWENAKKHMVDVLEVGESYFVATSAVAVASAIKKVQRVTGRKFSRRYVVERGIEGYRVWRVS